MTTPGSHGPGQQPQGGGPGWGPPAGSSQPGSVPQPGQAPGHYPPPQGQQPLQYPPQGQFPQGPGWTPPPQAKSSTGRWLAIGGGVLAVLVIAVVALALVGGSAPEVGDCLRQDGQELEILDCDDSAAAFEVVGIQDGEQSYDEYLADPQTCAAFSDAIQSFWVGENGDETGQGVVYCATTN